MFRLRDGAFVLYLDKVAIVCERLRLTVGISAALEPIGAKVGHVVLFPVTLDPAVVVEGVRVARYRGGSSSLVLGSSSSSTSFAISGSTTARGSASVVGGSAGTTTECPTRPSAATQQQQQAATPSSLSLQRTATGLSSGGVSSSASSSSGGGSSSNVVGHDYHHHQRAQHHYNAQLAPNNTATGGGGSPGSNTQSNQQATTCNPQAATSSANSKRRWIPPSTLRYRPTPPPLNNNNNNVHAQQHHHNRGGGIGSGGGGGGVGYSAGPAPVTAAVVPVPVVSNPPMPIQQSSSNDVMSVAGQLRSDGTMMGGIEAARQDQVFRKVRGILNKLTPEKFQKLSDDLLRMELSSYPILRGVIILIFNKALEEPKYSSMYAQLCKRLNEEVPHFVKDNKQCSFNLLLLNKCGDEFSKRRENLEQLNIAAEHHPDSLLDEEERRHLAKRKMLGNIKFMGELGKLEILSGHLLHKCIQELLYTSNSLVKMGEDPAEDLECLCQIMRTSGRLLDSEESQPLVNQYFKRLNQLALRPTLPPRIRFMLKDIIDLRSNQWMPRKATLVEGPMPIQQIRSPEDDHHMILSSNRNNMSSSSNSNNLLGHGGGGGSGHHHHHHNMNSNSYGGGGSQGMRGGEHHGHGQHGGGGMMGGGGYGRDYRGGGREHHRGEMGDHRGEGNRGDLLFRHPMKTRGGIIEEMFKGMPLNPNAPNSSSYSNSNNQSNNSSNGYNSGGGGNRSSSDSGIDRGGNNSGGGGGQTQRERDNAAFSNNPRGGRRDGGGSGNYGSGGGGQNQNRGQYKHNTGGGTGGGGNQQYNIQTNKELAPRFKKNLIVRDLNLGEVELRPSINPGAFNKTVTSVKMNNQVNASIPQTNRQLHEPSAVNSLNNSSPMVSVTKTTVGTATLGSITTGSSIVSPLLMHNKDSLPIKTIPADKQSKKNQKDKGVNKEEIVKRFGQISHRFTQDELNLDDAIAEIKEMKIPEKFNKDVLKSSFQTEMNRKFVQLVGALRRDAVITGNHMQDVLKFSCVQLNDDAENEMSKMAQVLSTAVQEQLLSLSDIAGNITENGAHYPLFWLLLQDLNQTIGKADLDRVFKESKVNLLTQLGTTQQQHATATDSQPPSSTTASGRELGCVLEARGLEHLCPLLRVQAQLAKQLQADPSAHHLYRWINENVDAASHTDTGFINALVTVLLQFISQEALLGGSTQSSTQSTQQPDGTITEAVVDKQLEEQQGQKNNSGGAAGLAADRDKAIADREKVLLKKYQGVLQKFLHDQPGLQLTALYAVQVYFHHLGFPRGQLLRWFNALYDLNIIDEEAFFSWKENVTDVYPGKGNALFQVNSWLTWLEESDYEEEEGEE